jgi:hypothetical protein
MPQKVMLESSSRARLFSALLSPSPLCAFPSHFSGPCARVHLISSCQTISKASLPLAQLPPTAMSPYTPDNSDEEAGAILDPRAPFRARHRGKPRTMRVRTGLQSGTIRRSAPFPAYRDYSSPRVPRRTFAGPIPRRRLEPGLSQAEKLKCVQEYCKTLLDNVLTEPEGDAYEEVVQVCFTLFSCVTWGDE